MSLIVYGVNYQSAPLAVRERIAYGAEQIPSALTALGRSAGVDEAVILSTCNRTEFYCHQKSPSKASVLGWLNQRHGLQDGELAPYLYSYPQEEAVRHLLRVACGLDSMVLGEPQILGQIKQAYQLALQTGTLGKLLNKLFQHAFSVAKQVRTDTAIGNSPVSIAFAAVRLAQQVFGDFRQHTALLIGAGETIELAGTHLRNHGMQRTVIANRSVERAELLAARFNGYAIALRHLEQHLSEADIIISATSSPDPILTKPMIAATLKQRKHRPIFIADIAVPRDVDPQVGELRDVYLYSIDDLKSVVEENLASRRLAAVQANDIITTQVGHFMDWLQSLDAVTTVRALRAQVEDVKSQALAKAQQRLIRGEDPHQVLAFLAEALTSKIVHTPTVKLREASAAGRNELLKSACELFDLPWPPESPD